MKRKMSLLLSILIVCSLTSACASKLTTIRPTLIDRIAVINVVTGETAEIIRDAQDETDWLMDDLVFQMEQKYNREGRCTEADEPLYELEYYMNGKLELSVYINSDGSVCKNGIRYVQAQQDGNTHPINPAAYEEIFELNDVKDSQN